MVLLNLAGNEWDENISWAFSTTAFIFNIPLGNYINVNVSSYIGDSAVFVFHNDKIPTIQNLVVQVRYVILHTHIYIYIYVCVCISVCVSDPRPKTQKTVSFFTLHHKKAWNLLLTLVSKCMDNAFHRGRLGTNYRRLNNSLSCERQH